MSRTLVDLYHSSGRDAEARALLMKSFRASLPRSNDNGAGALRALENQAAQFGQQLLAIDAPLDALRVHLTARDRLGPADLALLGQHLRSS